MRALMLAVVGLVVGAGLGLYIGWVAWPLTYSDANPAVLDTPYQDDYVQMVADTYVSSGDLGTATARLAALGPNYPDTVLDALNNQILRGVDEAALRRIALLANDLGLSSPAMGPLLAPEPAS